MNMRENAPKKGNKVLIALAHLARNIVTTTAPIIYHIGEPKGPANWVAKFER
jgi:hypothetical protein